MYNDDECVELVICLGRIKIMSGIDLRVKTCGPPGKSSVDPLEEVD